MYYALVVLNKNRIGENGKSSCLDVKKFAVEGHPVE